MGVYISELSLDDLYNGVLIKRDFFNNKRLKALPLDGAPDEVITGKEIHPVEIKKPHGDLKDTDALLKQLDDYVGDLPINYANARRVILYTEKVIDAEK